MTVVDNEVVYEALKSVIDPELGINIIDLGLVYGIDVDFDGNVDVTMTLTTPGCPLHSSIEKGVQKSLQNIEGIGQTKVNMVWEPKWSPDFMSQEAKQNLFEARRK